MRSATRKARTQGACVAALRARLRTPHGAPPAQCRSPAAEASFSNSLLSLRRASGSSLLGWSFSRYVALCRWGYYIGYFSEEEAWTLTMPVAAMLQKERLLADLDSTWRAGTWEMDLRSGLQSIDDERTRTRGPTAAG
ncbi:MAG: DUF1266 domain-containing protein [Thermoleophilia bacterium]